MKNCSSLFSLSALACQLAECLDENELALLSSQLMALADLLEVQLTQNDICKNNSVKNDTCQNNLPPDSNC